METNRNLISKSFQAFTQEAPKHSAAWMAMVGELDKASALDAKTKCLAYLAVLAVLRLEGGIPFHAAHAKKLGATRDEVVSALLVGLPAAGHGVTQVLPAALDAFDGTAPAM
jgi:alkylhydroperoxidase/carboxymuconolactone decarboxylase family protein YurZ